MRPPWTWWHRPVTLPAAPGGGAGPPCLVHLVRAANGLGSLRGFAEALRRHTPGIEYELVLAMKGFASRAQARPYLEEVADLAPETLFFADRRFDLGVYFATAARLRRERYCFVNSNVRPQVDGWLAKLDAALDRPGVGQVGATGSWASQHSWVTYSMGLPSAYRGLMPPPATARRQLLALDLERAGVERRSALGALRARLRTLLRLPEELLGFEPFPTRHLRPNAFMIAHAALRELRLFVVLNKMDTYTLESGRESITRQLRRIGLTSLVVDRAGAVYEPEQWHRSRTLWQGDQEGLLVADNQTRFYADAELARRRLLSTFAWGSRADPRPRRESPAEPSERDMR
jgi:hypothetical protein